MADKHRREIAIIVEAMNGCYFTKDEPDEVRLERIKAWIGALSQFSIDEVRDACWEWVDGNPDKRPNIGHIRRIITEKLGKRLASDVRYKGMSQINGEVATRHGVLDFHVKRKDQKPHVVAARHEAIAKMRAEGFSLQEVAEFYGMHHTSILSAQKKLAAPNE